MFPRHVALRALGPARASLYRWRRDKRPQRHLHLPACVLLRLALSARATVQGLAGGKRPAHRILFIHCAGLGDTLMLTPALRAVARRFPGSRVDLLTLHGYVAEAFRDHPLIAQAHLLPAYSDGRPERRFAQVRSRRSGVMKALWYFPDVVHRVVRGCYDLGVNCSLSTEYDHLGNALLLAAGIPLRLGMRDHDLGLLTHSAEVDFTRIHRADAYLRVLAPLGIEEEDPRYEFPCSEGDKADVRRILGLAFPGLEGALLAALNPGGSLLVNSRRWPAPHYAEVGRFLVEHFGARLVLLGGSEDNELCQGIADGIGGDVLNLAGRLTFAQTGALLSLCQLCITNDTGVLHLAEAVGTHKVVSIFGPTDPDLLAPRGDQHTVLRSDLPCAPCLGSIINSQSPRCWRAVKEECLWSIAPMRVIDAVRELLGTSAVGQTRP